MLLLLILCYFCLLKTVSSSATLEVDPAMARDRPSFITCKTSNQITRGVFFLTANNIIQGGCALPGDLCQSSVQGYSVTQNITSRITTLIIDSVNCTRETGSWYCGHGNDPESSPRVYIGCNTTKYAPSIDKSRFPSTFIAVKGRQLTVNCAPYTTPGRPSSTSYTWIRPGGTSSVGSIMQVKNVDTSDAGRYTCRASNDFSSSQQGQDSATLQLTVQFVPRVSDENLIHPVTELAPLKIDCRNYTTAGNPSTTSYRWTGPNSFSSSQPILSISSISRNQAGIYTCRASNTLTPTGGSTESGIGEGQFSVDVQYPPDISLFPIEGQQATDLTLTCTATGNPSNYRFEDFRQYWGDQLIQRRGGTQTGDRYSLDLPKVSYQDSGVYVCTVGNNVKQPSQKNTTVIVQAPPVYTNDTDSIDLIGAVIGHTAKLVQLFYCSPNFTSVSWHFTTTNTTTSRLSTDLSSVSSSLVDLDVYGTQVEVAGFKLVYTVTNFQQEHIGLYTVRVCNSLGCTESSLKLIGSGPPDAPTELFVWSDDPNSVRLSWKKGNNGGVKQQFRVQYKKEADPWTETDLYEDKGDPFTQGHIQGLEAETLYFVRVQSINKYGNSSFTDATRVLTKEDLVHTSDPSSLGVGAGVGIGVGITLLMVLVVLAVIVLLRHQAPLCAQWTNKPQTSERNTESRDANTTGSRHNQSVYAQFERTGDSDNYEKLAHVYQNTGVELKQVENTSTSTTTS